MFTLLAQESRVWLSASASARLVVRVGIDFTMT